MSGREVYLLSDEGNSGARKVEVKNRSRGPNAEFPACGAKKSIGKES